MEAQANSSFEKFDSELQQKNADTDREGMWDKVWFLMRH